MLQDVGGFVWRGLITGLELAGRKPFEDEVLFQEKTEDLTDASKFSDTVGFSYGDVQNLSSALCSPRSDTVDKALHRITISLPLARKAIFSAQDVVDISDSKEQASAVPRIGFYVPGTKYDMTGSWEGSEDLLSPSMS